MKSMVISWKFHPFHPDLMVITESSWWCKQQNWGSKWWPVREMESTKKCDDFSSQNRELTIKHRDNIGITWFFNEGYIMGLKGCLMGISYGSYTRYILGIYWVYTGYVLGTVYIGICNGQTTLLDRSRSYRSDRLDESNINKIHWVEHWSRFHFLSLSYRLGLIESIEFDMWM